MNLKPINPDTDILIYGSRSYLSKKRLPDISTFLKAPHRKILRRDTFHYRSHFFELSIFGFVSLTVDVRSVAEILGFEICPSFVMVKRGKVGLPGCPVKYQFHNSSWKIGLSRREV